MKRTALSLALLLLAIAACGPAELIITAEVEVMDPETGNPISRLVDDVEIQLLPFDRDQIFDSLTAAASSPEPQMPPALRVALDSVNAAQREWRESESRSLALREQLRQLSEELEQYNPAEAQYRVLFNEFNDVEVQFEQADATRSGAFDRFTQLQDATFSEIEEFRAILSAWEEQAFAPFGDVASMKIQLLGQDPLADTTDATGRASFAADPGEWWIYARYPLAVEELYWNEPVALERGDPIEIPLTRDNAEIRELF